MTIPEAREKCKSLVAKAPRDAFVLSILVFASSASFGLGLLAGLDAGQGSDFVSGLAPIADTGLSASSGQIVASKNGTKYYLPGCAGAERISEDNKVWFASSAAAAAAGYAPAANCKGI